MTEKFNAWLDEKLPSFALLSVHISSVIQNLLQQEKIEYFAVEHRTKNYAGVLEKVKRKKYKDPVSMLTDIAGIRVILFFEKDVDKVCEIIRGTFNVDADNSSDNFSRLSIDRIGYRSTHYVCDVGEQRSIMMEYKSFRGLKFEVQVRTILQHAWANLTHERNYKLGIKLPEHIQRKINLYSGMLEIADIGFSEIVSNIEEYVSSLSRKSQEQLYEMDIDTLNLPSYIKKICESKGLYLIDYFESSPANLSVIIDELEHLGIKKINEINEKMPPDFIENYKIFSKNASDGINIAGFLRDFMLVVDYRKLSSFPQLNWGIESNSPEEGIALRVFLENYITPSEYEEICSSF